MKQVATKTPAAGVTAPTGYTVFHVKTVVFDDNGAQKDEFDEHYEVCDDNDGLPIASDRDDKRVVQKAEAVLEFFRQLREGHTLIQEGSTNIAKGPGSKQRNTI